MARRIDAVSIRLRQGVHTTLVLTLAIAILTIPIRVYAEIVSSGDILAACSVGIDRTLVAAGVFAVGQWLSIRLERAFQSIGVRTAQ
jgi:hypothetical protein